MRKSDVDCDLYKQSEEVIKKYEDKAFIELALSHIIPCCGGHPGEGKHKKLFYRTACSLYEADKIEESKTKKKKKRLDKFR